MGISIVSRPKWGRAYVQYGAARSVYCLTEQGVRLLAHQWVKQRSDLEWKPRDSRPPTTLDHTLAVNEVVITMYRAAQQQGWSLEVVQSEGEGFRRGGYDVVRDPETGQEVAVKPDGVCRLVLPGQQGVYCSLEVDRGSESAQKIKAKAHWLHYSSGAYAKRYQTCSSRNLFIVADVRDPTCSRPLTQNEWMNQARKRCTDLKRWVQEAVSPERHDLFWFGVLEELTGEAIYQQPVWQRSDVEDRITFWARELSSMI